MKKRLSSVLMLALVGVMLVGLVGCGDKDKDTVTPNIPTPPPIEDIVVDEPMEVVVSTDDISNTLKNLYGENYLPSMSVEEDVFQELLGLTSSDYVEYFAETPMMSTHVDSLFVVKAADGQSEAVMRSLTAYRESLLTDSVQYPMNTPKIESSVVTSYGDYVIFMMLGGYPEGNDTSEADTVSFYKDQIALGLDALDMLFEIGYVEPENNIIKGETDSTDDTNIDSSIEVLVPSTGDSTGDVVVGEPLDKEVVTTPDVPVSPVVPDVSSADFD